MRKTDFSFMTDTDGDGLPDDMEEILGIPLPNGQLVFTDPENSDTDGDNLSDGEEVDYSLYIQKMVTLALSEEQESFGIFMFKPTSDPTKVDTDNDELNDYDELEASTNAFLDDTDDDGALDGRDKYPLSPSETIYDRNAAYDYSEKYYQEYNDDYPTMKYGDCANFVSQCLYAGGLEMNSYWYMSEHHFYDRLFDLLSNKR